MENSYNNTQFSIVSISYDELPQNHFMREYYDNDITFYKIVFNNKFETYLDEYTFSGLDFSNILVSIWKYYCAIKESERYNDTTDKISWLQDYYYYEFDMYVEYYICKSIYEEYSNDDIKKIFDTYGYLINDLIY